MSEEPVTPQWVRHAVFYQIFPDRFARSEAERLAAGITVKPWGAPPEEQGFQGGNLRGIIERLPYLEDLGVNALYLNPIFASAANHRYHTYDYYRVDPLLGGNEALRALLDAAHERGIRVVLDGVFNHASRGFWPFHHVLENGSNSPYYDWFIVRDHPLRPYPGENEHHNYDAWWDLPALPKLNTDNLGVRELILDVARYWLEFGIDGWRLDVPEEIDDDDFWRSFRQVVKETNPEAYICGEIWGDARRWLAGDQFDAVMNYPFMAASLSFFGNRSMRKSYRREDLDLTPKRAEEFGRRIRANLERYHRSVNEVQLNLLDSHDTARARWILSNDDRAFRLCVLFQMTMPGAPCIYYGDEIGLSAGDEPACREAFPWDREDTWDSELRAFYRGLIALRHGSPVLRTGTFRELAAERDLYCFMRGSEDDHVVVALNAGRTRATLDLPRGELGRGSLEEIWPGSESLERETSTVALEPQSGRVFRLRADA
jgi:neopullulanase